MSAYVPCRTPWVIDIRSAIRTPLAWLGLAALMAAAAVAGAAFSIHQQALAAPAISSMVESEQPWNPVLAVESSRADRRYGYVTVTGEVRNVCDHSLRHVEAVVEFFDRSGGIRRVESALIEMPSVAPSGDSAFSVQTQDDPAIARYRVRFRTLLGGALSARTE